MDSRYKKRRHNNPLSSGFTLLLSNLLLWCSPSNGIWQVHQLIFIHFQCSQFLQVAFKKKKEQRARIRKASTTAQISYWLSLAGTQQRRRSITHQLIRFIHTVNTVMAIAVVINHDFNSSVCMNLKDFISLVFCKRDGSKYAIQNYDCQ